MNNQLPIIKFHPSEILFPITIEEYLTECTLDLTDEEGNIIKTLEEKVDIELLNKWSANRTCWHNIQLTPSDPSLLETRCFIADECPLYYNESQYAFLMYSSMNRSYKGIWHKITIDNINKKIILDGKVYKKNEFEYKDDRPIIYVAKDTHIMSPMQESSMMIYPSLQFQTTSESQMVLTKFIAVPKLNYLGKWGPNGTSNPFIQPRKPHEIVISSTIIQWTLILIFVVVLSYIVQKIINLSR